MKKYAIFILLTFLMVGCSNEIEQPNNVISAKDSEKVDEASIEEKEKALEMNVEVAEDNEGIVEDVDDNSPNEVKELDSTDVISENELIAIKETMLQKIEEKDLFEYYNDSSPTADNKNNEADVFEELVYTIEDDAVYLPSLKENQTLFEEDSYTISATELQTLNIIDFIEEPISGSALISLNLQELKKLYPAISYSVLYDNVEYEVMIVEEDISLGITLIENAQLVLENISKMDIMIIK